MKTKIYKVSTHRAYKNGQLTDGLDMEGEFDNLGNQPKIMLKTYNPVTNKKRTFSNRDFKKIFQESSPNSLEANLKQLLKKSHKNKHKKQHNKQTKRRSKRRSKRRNKRRR